MSEYDVLINKYNALNAGYDQLYPKSMKHANTHANGGTDPITPGDIGAYSKTETYSKNETDTLLANKAGWSRNKITGSVLDWAKSQTIPTSGYAEPNNTDLPKSSYWLVNVLMSNDNANWKVVVLHGIINNEVWYRVYNYGVWAAEWRQSLDDRTTPAQIGAVDASVFGQTITAFGEVGVDGDTVVYAKLCLKKLTSIKCDLHISYKIESNTNDNSKWHFISKNKLLSLLGITSISSMDAAQSQVNFSTSIGSEGNDVSIISAMNDSTSMGIVGTCALIDEVGIIFGRYYDVNGSYGGFPISMPIYKAGTYGQIDFYSIDYAV